MMTNEPSLVGETLPKIKIMSVENTHENPAIKSVGSGSSGSEASLIRGIWVMIEDIEHPHPEVAQYIPRINVASKLRTLLMASGYEWQTPPNDPNHQRAASAEQK
jgi:hypothetical protein